MKKVIALYPGTFDPITNGHIDIIRRASELFDELIISIGRNLKKDPLFTEEERIDMIKNTTADFPNIKVDSFYGLVVDFAKVKNAKVIIRGLRAVSDFEFEFQMSLTNSILNPEITTIFMMPNEKNVYLNSSLVREIAYLKGNVRPFVPEYVYRKLLEKFRTKIS